MSSPIFYVADGDRSDSVYRVRAGGELDMAAQYDLGESLRRAELSEPDLLELDFTDVSFIDSTAIKALAATGRAILGRGGRIELAVGNENVFRVFEIAGLDRFFQIRLELAVEQVLT
jgi:anti-sigma B factor antagonist